MNDSFRRSPVADHGWAPSPWSLRASGANEEPWSPRSSDWRWLPPPPPARPANRGVIGLACAIAVLLAASLVGVIVHGAPARPLSAVPPISGTVVPVTPAPVAPVAPVSPPATKVPRAVPATIAALVNPTVVNIYAKLGYQHAVAAGTGMILNPGGAILTNNHVIDGATSIAATVVANGRNYTASVVGVDPGSDVAVLQLQGGSGFKAINTGDPSTVVQGDPVFAIGNAGGVGGTPSIVTGTVEAAGVSVTAKDVNNANAERLNGLIETTAPLQPGDSGGPLVNNAGEVIGMDTAAATGTQFESNASVGFAIPIDQALVIAHQILAGRPGTTVHLGLPGLLGVQLAAPGSGSRAPGAVVDAVEASSPAAAAGVTAGDTINSVDGQAVVSGDALAALMQSHHPGDQVTIGWTKPSGAAHRARVTLIAGPAN